MKGFVTVERNPDALCLKDLGKERDEEEKATWRRKHALMVKYKSMASERLKWLTADSPVPGYIRQDTAELFCIGIIAQLINEEVK